jgi:hypothetical protein
LDEEKEITIPHTAKMTARLCLTIEEYLTQKRLRQDSGSVTKLQNGCRGEAAAGSF